MQCLTWPARSECQVSRGVGCWPSRTTAEVGQRIPCRRNGFLRFTPLENVVTRAFGTRRCVENGDSPALVQRVIRRGVFHGGKSGGMGGEGEGVGLQPSERERKRRGRSSTPPPSRTFAYPPCLSRELNGCKKTLRGFQSKTGETWNREDRSDRVGNIVSNNRKPKSSRGVLLVRHLPGLQGGSQGGIPSFHGCSFACLQVGRGLNQSPYGIANPAA